MAKVRIEFETITEPYLHGYRATHDDKRAEVIRAYAQKWLVFRYVKGAMLRGSLNAKHATMQAARKEARLWLAS